MAQLTLGQRYTIESGLLNNLSYAQIGQQISKDRSVIMREYKRNSDQRSKEYRAELAEQKALERHKAKPKKKHFTDEIKNYVEKQLKNEKSPDQIAGRARLDGMACVSHETIYKYIWEDKKSHGKLYMNLRNKGKRYRKRGSSKDSRGIISNRVDIDQRPSIVESKERIGDLEIDLIVGKKHKKALLTINDRATGVLFMGKVNSKQASEIERKTIELIEQYKPLLKTITSDNGKEFANHENIAEQLDIDFYFAKPYHSWQRGANENLNGLVRQYFPKEHDFTTITDQEVKYVQDKLNNRPRKRFGYKTPNEVFAQKLNEMQDVAFIT